MQRFRNQGIFSTLSITVLALMGGAWCCSGNTTVVAWGFNNYGQTNLPPRLTNVVAIASQYYHSLALKADGSVVAWGDNQYHQVDVPFGLTNVVAIAAGWTHSLALKSDGTVVAWGSYFYYGGPYPHPTVGAYAPIGLANVVAIAAADEYSLALKADGTVVAWGSSQSGGTIVPPNLTNVVAISAGWSSHALQADGTVVSWGFNAHPSGGPDVVAIAGDYRFLTAYGIAYGSSAQDVIAIASCSAHDLYLKADGTIAASGYHYNGQNPVPATIPLGLSNVVAVAAGTEHSLALVGDGPPFLLSPLLNRTVLGGATAQFYMQATGVRPLNYQWRFNGTNLPGATNPILTLPAVQTSQTGLYSLVVSNAFDVVSSPSARLSLESFPITAFVQDLKIWPGATATFTATVQSAVPVSYQWRFHGTNLPGATGSTLTLGNVQLNQSGVYSVIVSNSFGVVTASANLSVVVLASWGWAGNYGQTNVPLDMTNVVAVAAGSDHMVALRADGRLVAWGANYDGQTNVPSGGNFVAIAAGNTHGVALKTDGTVFAWGDNEVGQTNVPSGLTNVVAIAAGRAHNVALKADGSVVAWGWNFYGQTNVPSGLTDVVAIGGGVGHSLALRANGMVVAWGIIDQTNIPIGLTNVVGIAAGNSHSLALIAGGTVTAWGNNTYGQTNVPPGLTNVVAIAGGLYHSLALQVDGTVVSWGSYFNGSTFVPMPVPAGLTHVIAIAAGPYADLALVGSPVIRPRLPNPVFVNNSFRLAVPSARGTSYRLEYKNSWSQPNWTMLPPVPGDNTVRTLTDRNAAASQRFYRVRLAP